MRGSEEKKRRVLGWEDEERIGKRREDGKRRGKDQEVMGMMEEEIDLKKRRV